MVSHFSDFFKQPFQSAFKLVELAPNKFQITLPLSPLKEGLIEFSILIAGENKYKITDFGSTITDVASNFGLKKPQIDLLESHFIKYAQILYDVEFEHEIFTLRGEGDPIKDIFRLFAAISPLYVIAMSLTDRE